MMAGALKLTAALLLALLTLGAATATADMLDDREAEPVVLTGADLPRLVGATPEEVVGFAWFEGWAQDEDGWVPVPLQVDERKLSPAGGLAYADPAAASGPDGNPMLDANDEIAMMAYDGGLPAGDRPAPAGVDPASRTSVRVSDPLESGQQSWIYLFHSPDSLVQDGGDDRVMYERDFDPLLDYSFPESSSVVTTRYDIGIRGRWMLNRLVVAAADGADQDILDGDKLNIGASCEVSELTLSRGPGEFLADIDGPVRAIRSVEGVANGVRAWRQYIFYEGFLETRTSLRDLPAGSSVVSALDLSRTARGMIYRNERNPDGVTVDGKPDNLATGATSWEQVAGGQGAVTSVTRVARGGAERSTFYEDRAGTAASGPMSCSGDDASFGAAGPRITSPDDARLEFVRYSWFDGPEADDATGKLRSRQVDNPLQTGLDVVEPAILVARARPSRVVLKPGQSRMIRVVVRNHGRKKAKRVRICARTSNWARARCRAAAKLNRGGKVIRRIRVKASRKARKGTRILPVRATASKARSYSDRIRVRIRPRG